MECPICGFGVRGSRGLASHYRHQAETHPEYRQWKEDQRWVGKVEGEDYVRCLECGHRAATLARHLKAAHDITADEYRARHGAVLIRPSNVTEKRKKAIQKGRRGSSAYDGIKTVTCPSCGQGHEVHKLSAIVPCPACKTVVEEVQQALIRKDTVRCLECGWEGARLYVHLRQRHGITAGAYRARHGAGVPIERGGLVLSQRASKEAVACPVCSLLMKNQQGLSQHFAHKRRAGDQEHISWQTTQEKMGLLLLHKKCNICGAVKLKTEFPRSSSCRDGRRGTCQTCYTERAKRNNPERVWDVKTTYLSKPGVSEKRRDQFLRRKYGISQVQYEKMLEDQGGGS